MNKKSKITKNRKGMFFTIAAIIFALLFISFSSVFIKTRLYDKMGSVSSKVSSIEGFMNNIEADLDRAVYISSYRSIIALNNFITSNGSYLADADAEFEQILVNGTIKQRNEIEPLMINQTLINWTTKTKALAVNLNINAKIEFISASVFQTSPWAVTINSKFNVSLEDRLHTASIKKILDVNTSIDIQNFEDPFYTIESAGRITRRIIRTNVTNQDKWNTSALLEHLEKKTYTAYNGSPSYLMRLEGSFQPSEFGIETLVDKNEFIIYSIPVQNRSSVDYIYWDDTPKGNLNSIDGISNNNHPDFKLDDDHTEFYNVTGDVIS